VPGAVVIKALLAKAAGLDVPVVVEDGERVPVLEHPGLLVCRAGDGQDVVGPAFPPGFRSGGVGTPTPILGDSPVAVIHAVPPGGLNAGKGAASVPPPWRTVQGFIRSPDRPGVVLPSPGPDPQQGGSGKGGFAPLRAIARSGPRRFGNIMRRPYRLG